MLSSLQPVKRQTNTESGFVLIGVLVLVALMMIALAVAAPKMAEDIRRDKELELMHRGQQYTRGIKLYYKKFNAYPTSVDQLVKTNEIRFLRKRYTDPMTGKDDWKIIHYGEQHVQTLGLFGQAAAAQNAGTPGANGTTSNGAPGSNSPFGGGSSFGSNSSFGSGSSFGSNSSFGSGFGASSSPQAGGATDPSQAGGTGSPTSSFGGGTGNNTGSPGGISATSPTLGSAGPMIGVKIPDTHASIKEYKKQKHYNEWEFVYDPMQDLTGGGNPLGGVSASGASGNSGFGSGSPGFGSNPSQGFGNTGFGNSNNGFGNSGPTTPTPTQPTQPTQPSNPQ